MEKKIVLAQAGVIARKSFGTEKPSCGATSGRVQDDLANQWAVLYLSDVPLLIYPYRSTMAHLADSSRTLRQPKSADFVVEVAADGF
jgi:hypothetical protein